MSILIQSELGHAIPALIVDEVMLGDGMMMEEVELERLGEEEEEEELEVEFADGVEVVLTAF